MSPTSVQEKPTPPPSGRDKLCPYASPPCRKPVFACLFRCIAAVVLLIGAMPARADCDIVYSARYYLPPGSNGHSHFHLYRINPDGSHRTQITFGRHDDQSPTWSPDGRWIAFVRDNDKLCIIPAGGGAVKELLTSHWNPNDPHGIYYDLQNAVWWPDSRHIVIFSDLAGDAAAPIIDTRTGRIAANLSDAYGFGVAPTGTYAFVRGDKGPSRIVRVSGLRLHTLVTVPDPGQVGTQQAAWADNRRVVTIGTSYQDPIVSLSSYDLGGKEKPSGRIRCRWPGSKADPYKDSIDYGSRSLLPGPPHTRDLVVYVQDIGNSGTRPDNDYWLANSRTGKMTQIGSGQFLAWSPDGIHFCTAEMRGMSPYGPGKKGYQRDLYTSNLQIGSRASDRVRSITSGLVWVTGADWR